MEKKESEERKLWESIKAQAAELRVDDPGALADWYLNYHNHDRPELKKVLPEFRHAQLLLTLYAEADGVYATAQRIMNLHQALQTAARQSWREAAKPAVDLDDLSWAKELTAEQKVKLVEAMGFRPYRAPHQMSCVSLQGSGLICTCTWPETVWGQPEDVASFRGESDEERRTATEKRNAAWDRDPEDEENEFDPNH